MGHFGAVFSLVAGEPSLAHVREVARQGTMTDEGVWLVKAGHRPITLRMHKGRTHQLGLHEAIRTEAGLLGGGR